MTSQNESSAPVVDPLSATEQTRPDTDRAGSSLDDVIDQARAVLDAALGTFQSSLALLRAELRLARSSASLLVALAAILAVLAIGAWLALLALIAAGVHELSGNWFIGVGSVFVLNALGIVWVVLIMRRCLRDLGMPRTRRMLSGLQGPGKPSDVGKSS